MIVECCSTLPLNWLVLDAEAAPISRQTALHLLQAMAGGSVTPLVRVEGLNHQAIEHALDMGAHGVLVPKIDTPEAARSVVDACFFPPVGRRGINPVRASGYFADVSQYLQIANSRTLCMVQIESATAVDAAAEIASVDHVDVLFIGPGDLAASLGQPGTVIGARMDDAQDRVLRAARDAGKAAGIFAYSLELARRYLDEGFTFVAVGNDLKALRESVSSSLTSLRS